MKYIYVLSIILVVACSAKKNVALKVDRALIKNQKADTLRVIEDIITNKSKYIGKPFDSVIVAMPFNITEILLGGNSKQIDSIHNASIKVYNYLQEQRKLQRNEDPATFVVIWQQQLNRAQVDSLMKANNYEWTPDVRAYFGKFKIKDLVKVDYKLKKQ